MKIIGLTGPSGSGKSEFCEILAKDGIPCINADSVYHKLLVPPSACLDALCARFGKDILNSDGTLDRKKLAGIVFAPDEKEELDDLNGITLKFVIEKIREQISELRSGSTPAVIVDAPTLFESGFDKECDLIIGLIASKDIRAQRITQRDGISYEMATERINAQKSDDFYTERCDIVIYNDKNRAELVLEAKKVLSVLEAR